MQTIVMVNQRKSVEDGLCSRRTSAPAFRLKRIKGAVPRPPGATVELKHATGMEPDLLRHRAMLDAMCGVEFGYPAGRFAGHGIVICGGGEKYLASVYVLVWLMWRHGGSDVWVPIASCDWWFNGVMVHDRNNPAKPKWKPNDPPVADLDPPQETSDYPEWSSCLKFSDQENE